MYFSTNSKTGYFIPWRSYFKLIENENLKVGARIMTREGGRKEGTQIDRCVYAHTGAGGGGYIEILRSVSAYLPWAGEMGNQKDLNLGSQQPHKCCA